MPLDWACSCLDDDEAAVGEVTTFPSERDGHWTSGRDSTKSDITSSVQPRAALMFTSGPSHGEAVGDLEGDPLYHASLNPEEYRLLLGENGFDVAAHVSEDPACRRTVWLAQKR